MNEIICSQGHVVEPHRETCSRCNEVIAKPEPVEQTAEVEATAEKPKRGGRKATVKIPKSAVISKEDAEAQGIDTAKVEAEAEKSDEVAEIVDDEEAAKE